MVAQVLYRKTQYPFHTYSHHAVPSIILFQKEGIGTFHLTRTPRESDKTKPNQNQTTWLKAHRNQKQYARSLKTSHSLDHDLWAFSTPSRLLCLTSNCRMHHDIRVITVTQLHSHGSCFTTLRPMST